MYEQRRTISGTIKRALLLLPAAGLLAAGTLLSAGVSQADTSTCHTWHVAQTPSQIMAAGDIYRVCDDRLEVLIIEDEHDMLAVHTIN